MVIVMFFLLGGEAILKMREMGIYDPRLCNFDGESIGEGDGHNNIRQ